MNHDAALFADGAAPASLVAALARYRMLIVDDEVGVLKALTRAFRQANYEVLTACDADQSLTVARALEQFDRLKKDRELAADNRRKTGEIKAPSRLAVTNRSRLAVMLHRHGLLASNQLRELHRLRQLHKEPPLQCIGGVVAQRPARTWRGLSCPACNRSGYRGRVRLYEVLVPDGRMRDLIASGANLLDIERLARGSRLRSLHQDAFEKVDRGLTTLDEIPRLLGPEQATEESP